MFEGHFGLRENPFAAAHQSRFIYPSPEHQEALAHLRYGIENREPFVLITGEVGTGKTTALFDALSEWEGRAIVGLITNSSLTRAELLEEIGLRLGMSVPQNATKPQIMVALERHLLTVHQEGLRAILLLDEAQNLERELLEEIRLLSNLETGGEKLVQIFLVGQPELEGRLQLPDLRQLRQRIVVHYRLRPLGAADAERYIHHRITVAGGHALSIFPADACAEVHRLTNGIPREMNHLCSQAMVCAFVEGAPAVLREHVRAAAEELEFRSVLGKERRTRNIPPAVERRQGPTIPGAAPPPEREAKAEAPKPAAPAVGAPDPGTWRPDPVGEDDGVEGPPRWNPAEFESRTDAADEDELEARPEATADAPAGDGVSEALEDEDDDAGDFEHEDENDEVDEIEDEDVDELDDGPETGPPRLDAPAPRDEARPVAPSRATADTSAPPADPGSARPVAEPEAEEPVAPPRKPPAPAASGEDWQSWFKSLTSEADTAAPAAGDEDAKAGADADEVSGEVALPAAETPKVESEPVGEGTPHTPGEPGPAEPIVEAASTSAFAAALRRAQEQQAAPAAGTEMPERAPAARPERTPPATPAGRARTVDEKPASLESLPPRLREKMAQASEAPREPNPMPARIMIAAALLLVVISGAFFVQRTFFSGGTLDQGGQSGTASEETTADGSGGVPAGSDGVTGEDAAGAPEQSDGDPGPAGEGGEDAPSADASSNPAAAADASPPPARPAPAESTAEPVAPAPRTTFVLAVGTYLNEVRAREEQARLSSSTRWQTSIATVQEDNVAMYRVTLGDFPSRLAAEQAASDLIERGLVDEARIIPVRPR